MNRDRWTRVLMIGAAALLGSASAGCSQAHLSPRYGASYNGWFVAQRANPGGPQNRESASRALNELDAQEAGGISANYRRTVAKDAVPGGQGQLLMVAPQRGGAPEAYLPPPSVPNSQ